MLYLTAQDAIALVLENNIDIEVSRYNPLISAMEPGARSSGRRVARRAQRRVASRIGCQRTRRVRKPGRGRSQRSRSALQRGRARTPPSRRSDRSLRTWTPSCKRPPPSAILSSPQPDSVQSEVFNLIQTTHVYTGSYQQGFLSGGIASVNYSEHYLNENAPTDVLNPSVAPSVSVSLQHNFLRGFGVAANARTITVARMNLNTTELNFKTQVISVVSQVLNAVLQPGRGLRRPPGQAQCFRNRANISERREAADRNRIGRAHRPDHRRVPGRLQRPGCGGFRRLRCGSRNFR